MFFILLNVLNMLMFGWWMVYMIVFLVFIVFLIVFMMIVVVFVLSFEVGLFMKMMEGFVMSLIVIVSFFCCFVDKLFMLGKLISVCFNEFSFMSFMIFFMNIWKMYVEMKLLM